jgi:hypothetical protein
MSTPAGPTDMQTAVQSQIKVLNAALGAIQARPITDPGAFDAVNDYVEDLESLYISYGAQVSMPQIDAASMADLTKLENNLQAQIDDSQSTQQLILGAAEAVAAFHGTVST